MRIGYACTTLGINNLRTCIQKNATEKRLMELIEYNLDGLIAALDYNYANGIRMFRVSSDIIPFGSSPVNKLTWWEIFREKFEAIADKVEEYDIRLSMHPGQYTVINSIDHNVVSRSIEDIIYHSRVLDSIGAGSNGKIIIHIGGIYDDKKQSKRRFIDNYLLLPDTVKSRLIIENDDKYYNLQDVLDISYQTGIPVVMDILHHRVFPPEISAIDSYWITKCRDTWKTRDGKMKIHYSEQAIGRRIGTHSSSVSVGNFMEFIECIDNDIDIMLEVKDKNLSAIKCINSINNDREMLLREWRRYKVKVLECDYKIYCETEDNLNNYTALETYQKTEQAIIKGINYSDRAIEYVWSEIAQFAETSEKMKFFRLRERYILNSLSYNSIKNYLYSLAVKYRIHDLIDSYYFL